MEQPLGSESCLTAWLPGSEPITASEPNTASEPIKEALASPSQSLIHCWSGPRCCSTSLLYSFAHRADTRVLDEPLYASYLKRTGITTHPGTEEILRTYCTDGEQVLREVLCPPTDAGRYLYAKHISKHKLSVPVSIFGRDQHVLLVREPFGLMNSWAKVAEPTQQELGYTALLEIISELRAAGRPILLVLSDDLVRQPEATLRTLCAALQMPWDPAMLSWPAGPKPYDGVWAPHWYAGTHKSTGFSQSVRFDPPVSAALPDRLRPLLAECSALFQLMAPLALRATSSEVPRSVLPSLDTVRSLQSSPSSRRSVPPPSPAAVPPPLPAATTVAVPPASPAAATSVGPAAAAATAVVGPAQILAQPGSEETSEMDQPVAKTAEGLGASTEGWLPFVTGGQLELRSDRSGKDGAGEEAPSSRSTHTYKPDPRNADVLVGMRDGMTGLFELVWRPQAKVSVLDSAFMLGDGLWEGLRAHRGVLLKITDHLERLYEAAKALDMDLGCTPAELQSMVYKTLDANGMGERGASGVHIRLMVSRGLKPTPYQSPYITLGQPLIVILPEWKEAVAAPPTQGLRLFTVHVRRGAPDVQDPGWNSHSKLNCIAACIQAKKAGADEALMLDPHGFVATCNSVNFFIVRKGEVWAPTPKYQMQGITRAAVIKLCASMYIPCRELDFSLTQVYGAEEVFVTGTFAGVTHVSSVDGRTIGTAGVRGPVTERLQQLYLAMQDEEVAHGRVMAKV